MPVKIALTYIVKDNSEYELFKQSLESFYPYVDGLFVVVNGLSGEHDKIHSLVKKYKGTSISISPQTNPEVYLEKEDGSYEFVNFSGARQASFNLVTDDFDYITWADTDDLLQGGTEIRNLCEKSLSMDIDLIFCTYYYSVIFDSDKKVKEPVIFHERERFVRNKKFKWHSWLHEVCVPLTGNMEDMKVIQYSYEPNKNQNLLWVHTANLEKSMKALERNVRILELQAKHEDYKDPRTLFYIAKTYFDIGTNDKLIKADEYLDRYIPMSGWDEEIANAYHYKGLIRQKLNDYEGSIKFFKQAIFIHPQNHLDYLRLTDSYFKLKDFEKGSFYLNLVSSMPAMKSKAQIGSPFEAKILYLTLKYQEAEIKGDLKEMQNYAELRNEFIKDGLLEHIKSYAEINKVAQGLYNYAVYLNKSNPSALDSLLNAIKMPFLEEMFVAQIANTKSSYKWKDDEICYYASFGAKHFEKWTPENLNKGIGGSESAVIYLSREWVKQGYKVVVYCDCGDDSGFYDGVEYRHYNTINWKDEFSTLILWRSPHLLDIPVLNAKRLFYDAHDIEHIPNWNAKRVEKVDKVFFKSSWHRTNLPQIPNNKAVVISNGVTKL